MEKLILSGWNGRMGKSVSLAAPEYGFRTVAGIGHGAKEANGTVTFPVYAHTADCRERADCVIDFSSPSFLPELLAFADKSRTPLVIGTTGYSEEEKAKIEEFSHRVPVFCSPNLSFGIGVLQKLCRTLPSLLGQEFDIEMTEIHHKNKKDAPSGTALLLAKALAHGRTASIGFGRKGEKVRERGEICLHSVRGGGVIGEHRVYFLGEDEVLTLTHSALDRSLFAKGALRAAAFLIGKPAGFYDMDALIEATLLQNVPQRDEKNGIFSFL